MTRVRPAVLGAMVILYLTLAMPVSHLIQGADWVGWYVGFGFMVFAIGLIGRSAGLANGLVGLIEIVVVPLALTAAFAADVAWAWIIPNARVWDRFTDLGGDLGRAFLLESSPLVAGQWIFAFVALSGALLAWVFDWYVFTVKAPAATGLFVGLVGVVAVAFVHEGLPLTIFVPMILAYLLLLALTSGAAHPKWGAPAVAALAATLGLVAGLVTPGLGIGGLVTGQDRGPVYIGGLNPLVDLGDDLRASPSTEALRYTSGAGPIYLRLTTLSQFDGTTWSHQTGDQVVYSAGDGQFAPLPGADTGVPGTEAAINVEITDLNSEWLPAPYQPTGLRDVDGAMRVDQDDLTLTMTGGRTDGQSYGVAAWLADPGSEEARELAAVPLTGTEAELLEPYTWLPDDLPAVIGDTARQVAARAGVEGADPMAQGMALENYFRESGFVYSMSTPAREGYDGDSGVVVARFLEVKAGYCVHFAAAMTLMARELGIGARVAVGYLPGNPVSRDGDVTQYSVAADRLHAWPELYVPGSGWVGFEPTVSRAAPSGYESASPRPTASNSVPPSASSTPSASASASAAASPSAGASPSASAAAPAPGPSDRPAAAVAWWVWSAAVFAVLVLAGAVPGLWRTLRRHRRLGGGLVAVWAEVGATAVDLGVGVPPWRTPAAMADQLVGVLEPAGQGDAARALERLAAAVEAAAYAPPVGLPPEMDNAEARRAARSVIRGLRDSVAWRMRLVAWWSPRSLRRPRRPR
ncbi:MAG: DUF3488 and transglutaminase-like domain-containing protein [Bifidobacteriaceae bacterium]|jgi:transglutaminase-like putative cysteine protease|nr:DUF3488 and transglutaminase-like domain-containing protein [Bifidobacteriaceae bacterium]